MKRLSLKIKLTVLYTFFMILVTCAALAILFSLSSREILSSTQSKLERRVQDSTDDIVLRDGDLKIDSDFYSVTQDVYLSLYDEDMYFLYGKVPYGFDSQPEFSDGQTRSITEGNTEWYVYDMSFRLAEDHTVYIRGITSVTDAEASFTVTLRFALILLPGLVIVTAFIGYRFTRRTLLPVKKITDTVRQIRADADLSRRIGITGGEKQENGKSGGKSEACRGKNPGNKRRRGHRDEIYTLADTFDGMLSELEEVFQREKQFTSDVSHELRTPVSVILAQCSACLTDETLSSVQREQIMLIQKKTQDMSEIISHLLFLSRADQGRQPLQKEYLNLSEITLMAVEEQRLLAEEDGRSVTIECRIEPELYAWADETFYIQMLVNLISNAVAYSKENGHITVSLKRSGSGIAGCVEDDGIGIAAEHLPHIWERFYRADASRTGREGENHSGLGLPMVKWIAEAHGGYVKAESSPGVGSRFLFGFPAEKENDIRRSGNDGTLFEKN